MKHAHLGLLVMALIAGPLARASDEDASGLTNKATETTYFFCRSGYESAGGKFFFSRTQAVGPGVGVPELVRSYHDFLEKNFGYPSDKSVSCPFRSGASQALAEQNRQQTIDNLHAANLGAVEVDWTYKPVPGAPAAPAPAALDH